MKNVFFFPFDSENDFINRHGLKFPTAMNHIQELSGAGTNELENKQTKGFAYKLCLIY